MNLLVAKFGLKDNHIQWSQEDRDAFRSRDAKATGFSPSSAGREEGEEQQSTAAALASPGPLSDLKRRLSSSSASVADVKKLKKNSLFR